MAFALPALPAIFAAADTAAAATTTTAAVAGTTAAATAASAPAWLGYSSLALSALGGAAGAYGQLQSAHAQAAADQYNASVAQINQNQAATNARLAAQAGEEQVAQQQRKTRAEVGQLEANAAASGVDVNKGSALDVRSSAAELGELDALTVRSNAAREAYGYQTQAVSQGNEAQLETFAASNAEQAGGINAAGTLLGSAAGAGNTYLKYLQAGGFTG